MLQMLRRSVELKDWLGCGEPRSVRRVMRTVLEEISTIDTQLLGKLLEELPIDHWLHVASKMVDQEPISEIALLSNEIKVLAASPAPTSLWLSQQVRVAEQAHDWRKPDKVNLTATCDRPNAPLLWLVAMLVSIMMALHIIDFTVSSSTCTVFTKEGEWLRT
ncbi:Vacuolar protein sorting-associated protein 51 [Portunus trituberculatus]|uniref:Vacuolar protein sorting-associated protein 51 n=1 Tax=Portunus trituberculatus TaxID=210409 RepID=A0A5B7EZD1_PORTR|nr:Vacuolar protein sorting-associated protein 51 [Portunus trituberculatus]